MDYWETSAYASLGSVAKGGELAVAAVIRNEVLQVVTSGRKFSVANARPLWTALRGRLVSFNQLNIVIGISAAYFSNYLILSLGQSDLAWATAMK